MDSINIPLGFWKLQWWQIENQQSPVYDMKWGLKILTQFLKKIRSFDAENLGSVDLRAAKLLAIKLWEWFYSAQTWLVRVGPGSGGRLFLRSPALTASNYAAL